MSDQKRGGALPIPDRAPESIVAFYLTQKTDLPAKFQGGYQVVRIKIPGSLGKQVEKPALRVTFSHDQSIGELVGLVGFGSDPRSHVLLPADVVSSVHCRIFAQLNSGPRVWLIDDRSTHGTKFKDDQTLRDNLIKFVHGRREAALGLYIVMIGPYIFEIRAPVIDTEVRRREEWFRINNPIPVTRSMLDRQLDGVGYDWHRMNQVGNGGNGEVYRYMEKHTALFVAVKEEELGEPANEVQVRREINYMKTLRHPYLVDILFSECIQTQPEPTQYTAMPLYLGDLWALLLKNPNIQTKERIITQVFEGMSHMHKKQILHRDLKPDNIFWVTESPLIVKIGDYGLATSLADHDTLFETCGTSAYMAPEVLRRNSPQTTAIDVFSLGATVFAILEHEIVMKGWYTCGFPPRQYNRVFENVANSPPKLYAGLVQSMMAPKPEDRPSLDICIEVVKGQHYRWTRGSQLVPILTAAPVDPIQYDIPRQQKSALDRARAWAIKQNLKPITQGRQPKIYQCPLRSPVKHDSNNQHRATLLPGPQAPFPQAVAVQAPKPSKPAPVQGVNFQDGLPSYEEATTSKNPWARLADSHEITKKRHRSKLNRLQNADGPIAEQRANPVLPQPKQSNKKPLSSNGVLPMGPVKSGVQLHVSATHSRGSASHSTSTSRARGQRPRHPRQAMLRPREHAPALSIRRTGTGRIRKTTLTGIKSGAVDMGKGIYQFARGLGAATCNIGCLTAQSVLMLYDMATREKAAPNAGLRLTADEKLLLVGMRAHSSRRQAERQMEDGQRMAFGGTKGLPRINEGIEPGGR